MDESPVRVGRTFDSVHHPCERSSVVHARLVSIAGTCLYAFFRSFEGMVPVHQRHLAVRLMLSSRRLIKVNRVTLIGRHIFFDHSLEDVMG
jgi:hypothetical protein